MNIYNIYIFIYNEYLMKANRAECFDAEASRKLGKFCSLWRDDKLIRQELTLKLGNLEICV